MLLLRVEVAHSWRSIFSCLTYMPKLFFPGMNVLLIFKKKKDAKWYKD